MRMVPNLSNVEHMEVMRKVLDDLVARGAKIDYVVLDTLSKAMGGLNQNADQDVTLVFGVMREILRRYGCSIEIIHHTGHGNKERERGSSAMHGEIDMRILQK